MTMTAVILLALVQGLTEFLPVSSSGHMALGGMLLGVGGGDITFEIVAHLGTLAAVLVVYRKDIMHLFPGLARREEESIRLTTGIVIGSIPTAVAGLFFRERIEGFFDDPLLVSSMLMVTGTVLFLSRFARRGGKGAPGLLTALLIGLAQAVALIPGISRSGFTISAGLLLGLTREDAARFSFLLSIPAVAGAALLELGSAFPGAEELPAMLTGFAISAVTGFVALKILLGFLKKGKFSMFSWYCWLLGLAGIIVTLTGS